jgi:hypothetical protein
LLVRRQRCELYRLVGHEIGTDDSKARTDILAATGQDAVSGLSLNSRSYGFAMLVSSEQTTVRRAISQRAVMLSPLANGGPVLDAAHVVGVISAKNSRRDYRPLDELAQEITAGFAVEVVDRDDLICRYCRPDETLFRLPLIAPCGDASGPLRRSDGAAQISSPMTNPAPAPYPAS